MSKINCYEDGLNSLINKIKIQMHQQIRKNRFQIQEIKKNDYQIKSNLLSVALNIGNNVVNSSKLYDYSSIIESKRRSTQIPLKSNLFVSPKKEKLKKKAGFLNKQRLMNAKCEIRAWTIQNTNRTDQI
ncbi:unnamed protein product [Paramecium sonneborni]|uniref:Uncharacterized protein n=1 Tax=Paramecium sonneborni TaxID=65129 RepID=A0A8S1L1X3_9CILI|nr:unnamed protein product [Paramecium sonneborni]CAD8061932.1 unnamed protein product [Paramecium sonneborni]